MTTKTKHILIAAATAGVLSAGGVAFAGAVNDDDATEKPIAGDALRRASAAALAHQGAGEVTGTEVGDEESYYEVEVTNPEGSQTDVQLDRNFNVVGSTTDRDDDR